AQLFFQEGADLGQAAADAGQPFDGLLGLAGAARRVLDKVVLQGGLVLVQGAGLALPVEVAHSVESALLVFVEVALHGAWGDVGQFGDVGMGQAPALQPQHLHLALDAGVRVMIAVVAYLRQDVGAEGERAHGYRSATGLLASSYAVATRLSCGNSASLSRARYNFKQLGIATQAADDTYGVLPPAMGFYPPSNTAPVGAWTINGTPSGMYVGPHVWLLPFIEQQNLFSLVQANTNGPYNGGSPVTIKIFQ